MNASFERRPGAPRRLLVLNLAMVAVVGVCATVGSSAARSAETAGRVFGHAQAGVTILARSDDFGIQRKVTVNAKGRYLITKLPIGNYSVTLIENGQPRILHRNVPVMVDSGSRVDFECAQGRCSELAGN